MKVKYFAWVRERIGKAEETVEPPADVRTVDDLIGWLSSRGEAYAYAFEKPKVIRAAIDHTHVKPDAVICRRPRDCVLPADDRRLSSSDVRHRDHPHPGSRFRRRAGNRGADARAAPISARSSRFSGICRGSENGEPIAALTLEHYPGMAEAEIGRHADEALSRWPLTGLTVIHRVRPHRAGREHRAGA